MKDGNIRNRAIIASFMEVFGPLTSSSQKKNKVCFPLNVNLNFKFLDCQSVK